MRGIPEMKIVFKREVSRLAGEKSIPHRDNLERDWVALST